MYSFLVIWLLKNYWSLELIIIVLIVLQRLYMYPWINIFKVCLSSQMILLLKCGSWWVLNALYARGCNSNKVFFIITSLLNYSIWSFSKSSCWFELLVVEGFGPLTLPSVHFVFYLYTWIILMTSTSQSYTLFVFSCNFW